MPCAHHLGVHFCCRHRTRTQPVHVRDRTDKTDVRALRARHGTPQPRVHTSSPGRLCAGEGHVKAAAMFDTVDNAARDYNQTPWRG